MSENNQVNLSGVLSRYGYMFPLTGSERMRAYVWLRGWVLGVAAACERIDVLLGANKRGFHWTRVREKFGAPSLAYQMDGKARFAINIHRPDEVHRLECAGRGGFDPVALEIHELILQTEVQLRSQCIICGASSSITNSQGPWASLCAAHRTVDLAGDLANPFGSIWTAAHVAEGELFRDAGVWNPLSWK